MKNIKRVLALGLAVVFVLAFAACGNTEENTATTANSTAAASDNNTVAATSGNITATSKVVATAGKTQVASITNRAGVSTIAKLITRTTNKKGNASSSFVKSLKGYKLKIFYPWGVYKKGTTLGDSALYCRTQVENEFDCTVTEAGVFENYNENLTAKLAARKAENQVTMVQNFNFASYFKNGYISDLTAAMNKAGVDFKDPWYAQDANAFFNINYKQYGWISYDSEFIFPFSIVYNKNLIKKAKLTDPQVLAEKGQWTWSKMEEYAKKLTTSKIIGLGGDYTDLFATMCAQKGTTLVSVKKGSAPKSNINNQTVKDCLSQLAKWCKNDKIFNTFTGKDWTYGKTQLAAGKIAMYYGSHDAIKTLAGNSVTDSYGIVATPTPTASKTFTNVAIPQFIWFIPSQFQSEAAKALFLRNELYRHNYRFAARDFQVMWGEYFDDKDVLSDACNLKYARGNNKTVFSWLSVAENSGAKYSTGTIISYVIKNNTSVQTAIDKYKSSLDSCYTDMWTGYKITGNV